MTETHVTIEPLRDGSPIEWTDYTFNPWIGCARVSPACTNCYAEAWDQRFDGGAHWGKTADRRVTSDANWRKPLAWDRRAARDGMRRRVFCASLADVFEARDDLDATRALLWRLIESTTHLDWLLLTKRPEEIMRRVPDRWVDACDCMVPWTDGAGQHDPGCATFRRNPWPGNVWVGTTVEDQERANDRIPHLLTVPAPVRFLSMEPLLGPVSLASWMHPASHITDGQWHDECVVCQRRRADGGQPPSIGWVIVGGESGSNARASRIDWYRSLRGECAAAGVPFHFKQHGEWLPFDREHHGDGVTLAATTGRLHKDFPDGYTAVRVGRVAAGRELDGRTWDGVPTPSSIPATLF